MTESLNSAPRNVRFHTGDPSSALGVRWMAAKLMSAEVNECRREVLRRQSCRVSVSVSVSECRCVNEEAS